MEYSGLHRGQRRSGGLCLLVSQFCLLKLSAPKKQDVETVVVEKLNVCFFVVVDATFAPLSILQWTRIMNFNVLILLFSHEFQGFCVARGLFLLPCQTLLSLLHKICAAPPC